MTTADKAIRQFSRHLAILLVLQQGLTLATVWGFLWGAAVLVLRASAGTPPLPLLWGLAGLLPCVVVAIVRARRRLPARAAVSALLDERGRCGGLLMAGEERSLGGWHDKLSAVTPPRICWDGRRAWGLLAAAACFLLLAFVAPEGLANLGGEPPLEVGRETDRLNEQIELLKMLGVLDPARADALEQKLAELREQASGKDPARTLEALDHLHNLVGKSAREAAEKSTRQNERLSEAEAMADLLRKGAEMLGPKLRQETLAELASLVDKSGLDIQQLTRHLGPELLKAAQARTLDPEQLRKMAEALRGTKGDLAQQVAKMHKAGLIDAELLRQCQKACECNGDALAALLKESKGKKGGRGGLSRGPGVALLTRGKPGDEEGYKFKEEMLPPGALHTLRSAKIEAPAAKPAQLVINDRPAGPAASGALKAARAGGGSANTETILPRHRAAVERYFDRAERSEK